MSDLIDKLNTLIRAKVNSSLSGLGGSSASDRDDSRRSSISDPEIDAQLRTLRQQIDAALNAEDAMQKRVDDANVQMHALDQQIDAALLDGNDAQARTLTQQLQRQRQQTAMLAADLEDHRRATSGLIEQVNELEALVSDARARDQQNQGEPLPPDEVLADNAGAERHQAPVESQQSQATPVSVRIHVNRSAPPLSSAASPPQSPSPLRKEGDTTPTNTPATASPSASTDTDAELARRRERLAGPDKP